MNAYKFNQILKKVQYDDCAVELLYKEYYLKLKMHIMRRFGNLVESEDILQDIFLKLIYSTQTCHYIKYPTAWLFSITDNYIKDYLKQQHTVVELLDTIEADWDYDKLIEDRMVKDALKKLDKISRVILYMHIWEGYSYKEIALELKMNYSNVRTIACRAYHKLKKFL